MKSNEEITHFFDDDHHKIFFTFALLKIHHISYFSVVIIQQLSNIFNAPEILLLPHEVNLKN